MMNSELSINYIARKLGQDTRPIIAYPKMIGRDTDNHNSAVLIPLIIIREEVNLLYTVRSSNLERHSGQVSFPGGLIEKDDKSSLEAALRETEEEIGIERENIHIIGHLPAVNSSTGYIIYPHVGILDTTKEIKLNTAEVKRVFCIPLSWLLDNQNATLAEYCSNDGKIRTVWYFKIYDKEILWGITAKITMDFLDEIKK